MLIYNAIRTPDGTILESHSRHDYRTHLDTNGREYMIDGGKDYCRRSNWGDEEDLVLSYEDTSHEDHRHYLKWGTRGPKGDQPLRRVAIKDMDTDHIEACLETQTQMSSMYREVMTKELEFREATKRNKWWTKFCFWT